MQLLEEEKLVWSPVVANSRMNRKRNSSGINSYEKEFHFKPEEYLETKIKTLGTSSWLDICCGEGNALLQTARYLSDKNLQEKARLKGIDLLDCFQQIEKNIICLQFESASIVEWIPGQKYDLITCSHGIHYLGDKLKVLEAVSGMLEKEGLFIANLDLANIIIEGMDTGFFSKNLFKKTGIEYNSRTKIIKQSGPSEITFDLVYLGADDQAGPNYTGQEAVNSYYRPK